MAITGPTKINRINGVLREDANGIRAYQEAVAIEKKSWVIVIIIGTYLCRIAWPNKILPVIVCKNQIGSTISEGVQTAIGIFFLLAEISEIKLIAVIVPGTENTHRTVDIVE